MLIYTILCFTSVLFVSVELMLVQYMINETLNLHINRSHDHVKKSMMNKCYRNQDQECQIRDMKRSQITWL
ncbi:hypothetical protein RchiOBHm_Chr3g0475371 [Rosa chinensis]|uniref:Uncharacterized protein n=1 Tax=Rosa chinensis TaxID=74649 RepID=A0A2P6RCD0_ROSCH|nr:hypothetical protein RchiOBHm_Chr3g0475371 [Rosa chinensis]